MFEPRSRPAAALGPEWAPLGLDVDAFAPFGRFVVAPALLGIPMELKSSIISSAMMATHTPRRLGMPLDCRYSATVMYKVGQVHVHA